MLTLKNMAISWIKKKHAVLVLLYRYLVDNAVEPSNITRKGANITNKLLINATTNLITFIQ